MRYRVRHVTSYTYDDDVTDSLGIAYVLPRSLTWQQVTDAEIGIDPAPADLSQEVDFYGNTVTYFQVSEPHRELAVTASSHVDVVRPTYERAALEQPWEAARPLVHPAVPGAWAAADLAITSPMVQQVEAVSEYGAVSLTPGRALGEAVADLMHRIHRDFEYDQEATTVTSTVAEIFNAKGGVCQDFAHLMLACLRPHGLAGRYVSGYLATTPPPGQARLVGADASHAWVAIWAPGAGEGAWLMVDPTNDTWVDDRYVTVAWGRDYADVPPVKGVIFTEATTSTLAVSVDVAPVG